MKRWMIGVVACATVLVVGLPAAQAQLKGRRAKIKVRGKYKVRSKEALKRKLAAKKIRAEEFMLAKIKAQVESIILRQRRILMRRLKYTPDSDNKYPEYLFRLASLDNEMQDNYWMRAMAQNEKIFQEEERKNFARVRSLKDLQARYFKAHQAWLTSALMNFLKITQKFPKYGRMDEVFFHISNTAKKLIPREKDRARKEQWQQVMLTYFRKLLQQFPTSRYVPDALLAYAEYAFNNRQFAAALKLYERITKYRNSPVRPYAIYKIGWVYLNLKQYHNALAQFLKVLKIRGGKMSLIGEARKDVVRTFAHIGKPEAALRFFRRNDVGGVKHYKWMLVMLGEVFYSQGKNDSAIYVFDEAQRQWPRDKDRCKWMLAVVDANINVGDKGRQVEAIRRLGKVLRSMTDQFGVQKTVTKECTSQAANIMRLLATQWHNEAQKTKNWETLFKAQFLYKTYINSFPKNPDVYVMSYYYADLLFLVGENYPQKANWPLTAEAFKKVLMMKKPDKMPHKEYVARRNAAALAQVECWMRHFNIASAKKLTEEPKEAKKEQKGKCIKMKRRKCIKYAEKSQCTAKPITSDRLKMIEAFDTYIQFVPSSEWLVKIKYNKALIFVNHGHCTKALPFFMEIATKHQDDDEPARYSARMVIAILKEQKKYTAMRQYIDVFLASKKLMADLGFKLKMQEFKRNAMWEDAEKLKATKRYKECGDLFYQIAVNYPQDTRLGDLYWNAGVCYESAKLIGMAVRMRKLLRDKLPKHKMAPTALYFIGGNYHALAFYDEAAQHYEDFALSYSKKKEAPQALKWAILFRWGTGNIRRMFTNVRKFIETYTKYGTKYRSQVAEVHFWVHKVYEDNNDEIKLITHLNQYLSRYRSPGGIDREVEALAKLGWLYWKRSCKRPMVDGMCIRITYQRRKRRKKLARKKKKVRYLERSSGMVRSARGKFNGVLSAWRRVAGPKGPRLARLPGKTPEEKRQRATAAMYHVAMAQFMLADMQFEAYMKLDMPKKLNFNPRNPSQMKRSQKKFAAWAKKKAIGLDKLRKQYELVMKTRQAHWAIAAVARIGMLFHNFARQLYDAPIPPHLKSDEEQDAYRDELQKYADPLEAKAKGGYTLCLATAKKYNWFNEWSRLCEKELNDLDATRFPLTMELRAQPGYVSTATTPGVVVHKIR